MLSSHTETSVLSFVIEGATTVIPMQVEVGSTVSVTHPYQQSGIGVLIGLTGDIRGRLILDSNKETLGAISEKMYGMVLSGDMLESFAGELGNMISGNMATELAERDIHVDITPPTILVGNTRFAGFTEAIRVTLKVEDNGNLNFILTIEE